MTATSIYAVEPLNAAATADILDLGRIWHQALLRPGLWISVLDCPAGQPFELGYRKQPAMVDFGFILSGRLNHRWGLRDEPPSDLDGAAGLAGIGYLPGRRGVVAVSGSRPLQAVHIHVAPDLLRRLLDNDLAGLPAGFRSIFGRDPGPAYLCRQEMDPDLQCAVRDIFSLHPPAPLDRLYLEGKALELIALRLNRLMAAERPCPLRLDHAEIARVHEAHDRLVRDLADPPPLKTLCRQHGLNLNKLQHGFHRLYGQSVYGYLREYRLQRARQLLEAAEMNVSQVAWNVGYVNVSHFTRAYKRRFGLLPKHVLQSLRNREPLFPNQSHPPISD